MTNYFDAAVRLGVWREYFSVTPAAEHDSGFPRLLRAPTPRLSRPTRHALGVFADNHYPVSYTHLTLPTKA